MAAQYAYVMKDMTKTFPGAQKPVLSNINLQFYQGAKIGIVGPNGVGKSTLLSTLAGHLVPDSGSVSLAPRTATVGLLPQEPDRRPGETLSAFHCSGIDHPAANCDSAVTAKP